MALHTTKEVSEFCNIHKETVLERMNKLKIVPKVINNTFHFTESQCAEILNFKNRKKETVEVEYSIKPAENVIYVTQTYHIYNSKMNYEN